MPIDLICGDALSVLERLPDEHFQCCVTSPPYWGLRNYGGAKGQLGMESDVQDYKDRLVTILAEVYRVLRADGTLWLNLGDSYTSNGRSYRHAGPGSREGDYGSMDGLSEKGARPPTPQGLKAKELVGVPWLVAFDLQSDGWYLRSDCVWAKPNPMPESVRDRPTRAHEYVFMLTKSANYHWNTAGAREPVTGNAHGRGKGVHPKGRALGKENGKSNASYSAAVTQRVHTRNIRTVWNITPQPYKGEHYATFPEELARRCLQASAVGGHGPVLDPFCGSGTVLKVARELGLSATGIDIHAPYIELAQQRVGGSARVGMG